jgi:putative oxidoreductase
MALWHFSLQSGDAVIEGAAGRGTDDFTGASTMSIRSLADRGTALAEAIPDSLVSLTARIAAGDVFWRSGQTKIEGFHVKDSTFFLFREEYMVPLLPPDVAAYMATAVENVLSVLLIAGLASRLSAAGLLVMTTVIQSVYPSGWPEHILWAAALLIVVTRGPGVVSVDHLLFRTKHIGRFRRAAVGTA